MSSARTAWIGIGLILAGGLIAYGGTLEGPFVFDDIPGIVQNASLRDLRDLGKVLLPPAEGAGIDSRPIVNLSLALNYAAGGLDPRGYRLTNLGLHLAAALLLFGIVRRTLTFPRAPAALRPQANTFATAVAGLWTVHPLQTETVICVIQRTESLVSLFYLLTFYAFIRALEAGGRRGWYAAAWGACLLGMAAKEVMVSAPLMLLLYDRTFVAGTFRDAWQRRRGWYLAFASTWLLLAALVVTSGGDRGGTAGFGLGVSSWTYSLTQARALAIYLKLSFWPHPLIIDYGDWLAGGIGDVFWEGLLVLALLIATGWALVRRPAAGFVGTVGFALLAPSSSFYPLISQTIAEHRMHLPLASVLLLALAALFRLPRRVAVMLCALLAAAGVAATIKRGRDYRTELTLWLDLVAKAPANPWAHFHVGQTHFEAGRLPEAEAANRSALALRPTLSEAHAALALTLERQGRVPEALAHFEQAAVLRPSDAEVHGGAARCLWRLGRLEEALAHLDAAVRLRPNVAGFQGNRGAILLQLGRLTEAATSFERVLVLQPDSVPAHYNLALLYEQLGQDARALTHLSAAARLAPHDAEIQAHLARRQPPSAPK